MHFALSTLRTPLKWEGFDDLALNLIWSFETITGKPCELYLQYGAENFDRQAYMGKAGYGAKQHEGWSRELLKSMPRTNEESATGIGPKGFDKMNYVIEPGLYHLNRQRTEMFVRPAGVDPTAEFPAAALFIDGTQRPNDAYFYARESKSPPGFADDLRAEMANRFIEMRLTEPGMTKLRKNGEVIRAATAQIVNPVLRAIL